MRTRPIPTTALDSVSGASVMGLSGGGWGLLTWLTLAMAAWTVSACGDTKPNLPPSTVLRCDEPTVLFPVADALADPAHPCHDWVVQTHGRVAGSGSMSAVIWSLDTEAGTGVMLSAIHTLGEGWFGAPGSDVSLSLTDPSLSQGVSRIFLASPGGGAPSSSVSPMFSLFNPAIPSAETGNQMADILPRHDFYAATLDDQSIETDSTSIGIETDPLRHAPPLVDDPDGLTRESPTWADLEGGDLVLCVGYPMVGDFAQQSAASAGRVLDDAEAELAIEALAAAGDEEGQIPYDAEVERLIEGAGLAGMSGGATFDTEGRLVGVLVRASTDLPDVQYLRVVRMSFVVDALIGAYQALDATGQATVAPYLDRSVWNE